MSVAIMGLIVVAILVVLLVLRMPIGFIFLFVAFIGMLMIRGADAAFPLMGQRTFDINRSYELAVVPLFLLMGHLTYCSGITQELYVAARNWLGHLKGGLVMATTMANAAFGACCGSTTAATAVFGKVAIPEMLRYGVNRRLAAGCVAASGSLSAIIPPSVLIVIFGILAVTSVARLLIAGIIPGVLQALLFSAMVYIRTRINPSLAPSAGMVSWNERLRSVKGVWGVLVLFLLVMGGIWGGIFTPTEGGAVGAMGAFLLVLARRKFTRAVLEEGFLLSARSTATIFICVTGTMLFTMFLALTGMPDLITTFVVGLPVPSIVIVIGFLLILIALGCVIDPVSMMVLTIPIFMPIVEQLGFDPIWFGILVVTTCEMGMVTPPMGLNCFMLHTVVPELSLRDIFAGIWWYVAMWGIALALYLIFPQIILFLPNTMFQ